MRTRRLVSTLALLLVLGAAWGQGVELKFMYWGSAAEDRLIRRSLAEFEAANPGIKVKPLYAVYSGTDFDAKIRAMAEDEALPDLSYFTSGDIFFKYASAGMFLDLSPYVEREDLRSKYIPQVWITLRGRIYGILTAAECQVVYYNRKTLADAGIEPPPTDYRNAWTWDQYLEAWKKLTVDTAGRHPGERGFDSKRVRRFGVYHENWSQMLFPGIWGNGGDIFTEDGKDLLIDRPEAVRVIQRIADLRNKDMVMSAPGLTEYNNPTKDDPKLLLKDGRIGFYVSGQWELLDFARMGFPLGIGALPIQKRPAQVYISGINVVFSRTKNPEAAWKLQRWLMSPESSLPFYSEGLWMPTERDWYKEPQLSRWASSPAHPEGFAEAVLGSMEIARLQNFRHKNEAQIWAQYLNPALDRIWKGQDSAQEGLSRAAEKVRGSGLLQGVW
jgi:multiple sugar transport system substrate-binding protein